MRLLASSRAQLAVIAFESRAARSDTSFGVAVDQETVPDDDRPNQLSLR
jgi:hypothetical protein